MVGKILSAVFLGLWWLVRQVFDLVKGLLGAILGGMWKSLVDGHSPENFERNYQIKQRRKMYEQAHVPRFLANWYIFKYLREYEHERQERERQDIEEGRERPPR